MIGIGQLFGGGGFLLLPALVVAVAIVLVLATQRSAASSARSSNVDEAVEIVRQRFARGEIDAEEYSRMVSGLTRTR
jgi:putative membrane protein